MFGWCSWLSRQSNTLKVPSSILGSNTTFRLPSSQVSPAVSTDPTHGGTHDAQALGFFF